MALLSCPDCGHQVSDQAPSCPSCGRPLARTSTATHQATAPVLPEKKSSGCLTVVLILLAIPVGIFLIFFVQAMLSSDDPEVKARHKAADVIEYCEADYQKKTQDPRLSREALGFVYGVCEKLKDDYRAKYGRDP